jgi:hypothetical protein
MVSANENVELTHPFSPEEVGKAIMEMKADSAPGPDGLPVVFFQVLGENLGGDHANVPRVVHWDIGYVSSKFRRDNLDPQGCGGHRYPLV